MIQKGSRCIFSLWFSILNERKKHVGSILLVLDVLLLTNGNSSVLHYSAAWPDAAPLLCCYAATSASAPGSAARSCILSGLGVRSYR